MPPFGRFSAGRAPARGPFPPRRAGDWIGAKISTGRAPARGPFPPPPPTRPPPRRRRAGTQRMRAARTSARGTAPGARVRRARGGYARDAPKRVRTSLGMTVAEAGLLNKAAANAGMTRGEFLLTRVFVDSVELGGTTMQRSLTKPARPALPATKQ